MHEVLPAKRYDRRGVQQLMHQARQLCSWRGYGATTVSLSHLPSISTEMHAVYVLHFSGKSDSSFAEMSIVTPRKTIDIAGGTPLPAASTWPNMRMTESAVS